MVKDCLYTLVTYLLTPILYLDGKRVKKLVPTLPAANMPEGIVDLNHKETLSVAILGESTMAGLGVATHQDGFTGNLCKELAHRISANIHWEVFAKAGYTAKKVSTKLLPKTKSRSYDLLVIGIGANDAFTLNKTANWKKNISELISKISYNHPRTPTVFIHMPPIKSFPAMTPILRYAIGNWIEKLGRQLDKIISKHPKMYFCHESLNEKFKHADYNINELFSDGIHPSKLTYKIWANLVADFIIENKILDRTWKE